jgi:hypothetical protein
MVTQLFNGIGMILMMELLMVAMMVALKHVQTVNLIGLLMVVNVVILHGMILELIVLI